MERLTQESNRGGVALTFDLDVTCEKTEIMKIMKLAEKLKEYEDAEEQGLLLRLPCKVGTDVYYILGIPNETPCTIDSCVFELSDVHKISESLFLTREEAEAKLIEMEVLAK